MAWPTTVVSTGDLITAAQLNLLPIRLADSGVLGGSQASIDFTSIPSVFTHLRVFVQGRGDAAGLTELRIRFNNDSAGNYDYENLNGIGAVSGSGSSASQNAGHCGYLVAATGEASVASQSEILIASYAGTTFKKSWVSTNGAISVSVADATSILAGRWNSTAAINRITLLPTTGNFLAGTRATLVGYP
jgi:hypothetical protein